MRLAQASGSNNDKYFEAEKNCVVFVVSFRNKFLLGFFSLSLSRFQSIKELNFTKRFPNSPTTMNSI